ncbi:MAG: argininosuccinate lyase [Proteobacteria bacterium]|nr:argininosuccinate lyase [Pseudomonadota bacterium]
MTKPLWDGRLSTQLDQEFSKFQNSISFDIRLAPHDVQGSLAHAEMLVAQGILNEAEGKAIIDGLCEILATKEWELRADEVASCEDIHSAIELLLKTKIGSIARKLHTGRSRNDQVATDFRLYVKECCQKHIACLQALRRAFLNDAEYHLTSRAGKVAVLAGYTHLQLAQPLHLSHWYMAHYEIFSRDEHRFVAALNLMDECPLGAAALGGTSWPIDRHMTAQKLSFRAPMKNSLDAVSSRDFVTDYLHAAASLVTNLSRLAEDLIIYSTSEFGFVRLPDRFSTGSSIMPQKKNPDFCELTRAKAGRVYGHLVGTFAVLKALPSAYNKDLQEDKEAVFDVFDTVQPLLGLWTRMLPEIQWNLSVMYDRAGNEFSSATELADELSRLGLPFRDAYQVVGKMVGHCHERSLKFEDLTSEELTSFHPALKKHLLGKISVDQILESRTSFGASGTQQITEAIERVKESAD